MRALPSGIFKILCSQKTMNIMNNFVKTAGKVASGTISQKLRPIENSKVISLIKNYQLPVPWEQITKALGEDCDTVKKQILRGCSELKNPDLTMSFYKYVIDKGQNFNEVDLFMIIKTLSYCSEEKILEYEELLVHLYYECKEFILASQIFQPYAMRLFSNIPYCYKELLPMVKNNTSLLRKELICRAFDLDDLSNALELLESSGPMKFVGIIESFSNFCIRQALQNKFSIEFIQSFVNLCQKKGMFFYSTDIICCLLPLVTVLTHCQDDYTWSVRKCTVNPQMECLNCYTTLKEITIDPDEFEMLKKAVFEALIPKKDVFLKTTHSELNAFKHFLNTCEPYDMVVDGLNFIYRGIHSYKRNLILHLFSSYIKLKKRKVLVISRQHFQKDKFYKHFPGAQFFCTENSSDDDLFILYAAMHAGLGTNVLTSDFLVTHSAKLDPKMKILFIKWQLSHQYIIDPGFGIVLPNRHLGLPQCTASPETGEDSYKWHLSYQEKSASLYSFRLKFDWVCLQAIPKKRIKQKNTEICQKPLKKSYKTNDS